MYSKLGRHQDALALQERVTESTTAALGFGHPDTLRSMRNVAAMYSELGRHQDALALQERVMELTTAALGPGHPDTLRSMGNLASTYSELGRHQDAMTGGTTLEPHHHHHHYHEEVDEDNDTAAVTAEAIVAALHTLTDGFRTGLQQPDDLVAFAMGYAERAGLMPSRGAAAASPRVIARAALSRDARAASDKVYLVATALRLADDDAVASSPATAAASPAAWLPGGGRGGGDGGAETRPGGRACGRQRPRRWVRLQEEEGAVHWRRDRAAGAAGAALLLVGWGVCGLTPLRRLRAATTTMSLAWPSSTARAGRLVPVVVSVSVVVIVVVVLVLGW
jgi:hypothetical protein